MTYHLTPGVLSVFPTLDELLTEVKSVACAMDRDIRTRDLRVEACKAPHAGRYWGWAYPVTRRRTAARTTYHADGLVRMFIGAECEDVDIIRLYAHELRHVGQFHRGRKRYGTMTVAPMSVHDSEQDAEEFEQRCLERIL